MTFEIHGQQKMTPENQLVFSGSPDAKSTEFGTSVGRTTMKVGAMKYKALETGFFVGTSRFLLSEQLGLVVEWTHFQVIPMPPRF
jgi:hypothetical protein